VVADVAGAAVLVVDPPPPQAASNPAMRIRSSTGRGRRTGVESNVERIAVQRSTPT
jgi:hypothetical protein